VLVGSVLLLLIGLLLILLLLVAVSVVVGAVMGVVVMVVVVLALVDGLTAAVVDGAPKPIKESRGVGADCLRRGVHKKVAVAAAVPKAEAGKAASGADDAGNADEDDEERFPLENSFAGPAQAMVEVAVVVAVRVVA
jgi:hypothetical protein